MAGMSNEVYTNKVSEVAPSRLDKPCKRQREIKDYQLDELKHYLN